MKRERYLEYLNSKEWKNKKSKVINRAKAFCEGCGETNKPLEVHHLTYDRIGDELLTDLVAFCPDCHSKAHGKTKKSKWNLYINGECKNPNYLDVSEISSQDFYKNAEIVKRTNRYVVAEYEDRNSRLVDFAEKLLKKIDSNFYISDHKGNIIFYQEDVYKKCIEIFGDEYEAVDRDILNINLMIPQKKLNEIIAGI